MFFGGGHEVWGQILVVQGRKSSTKDSIVLTNGPKQVIVLHTHFLTAYLSNEHEERPSVQFWTGLYHHPDSYSEVFSVIHLDTGSLNL